MITTSARMQTNKYLKISAEHWSRALETHIPNLVKDKLLEDVDGSKMQRYYKDKKEILVKNSNYIGAVFIESEIELEPFFKK